MFGKKELTLKGAANLPLHELEGLSEEEKEEYFGLLRKYCTKLGMKYSQKITPTQRAIARFGKIFRAFPLEIAGAENMPKGACLVMSNHSNTHDSIVPGEVFATVNKPSTYMIGVEGMSPVELALFKSTRATMIRRTDKESSTRGLYELTGKLLYGDTCVIFGEGTWNLHPYKPMQNIRIGGVKAAAIAGVPIVPIILEYVEVPGLCSREKDLYSKCIAKIGKPIRIDRQKSLIKQNDNLQTIMENMRMGLWKENGTYRDSIEDVNANVYVNHTWLKKFGTPLFTFDTQKERGFLFVKRGEVLEYEWCIDRHGRFAPGIISKSNKD